MDQRGQWDQPNHMVGTHGNNEEPLEIMFQASLPSALTIEALTRISTTELIAEGLLLLRKERHPAGNVRCRCRESVSRELPG